MSDQLEPGQPQAMTAASRSLPSTWSIFTKPWRELPLAELADLVAGLGFDGVEFPLRPGFQIDLDDLPASAAHAGRVLTEHGLRITSVASTPTEPVFAACADLGVPVIRIMAPISPDGYVASGTHLRTYLDSLLPLCERFGVGVGIQPHIDDYVADSSELATVLAHYGPAHIVAVWDSAHDAMARKAPGNALDTLWSHLAIVNVKNVRYEPAGRRSDGSEAWNTVFVPGPDGLGSWSALADALVSRDYRGPICMAAEYTDESDLIVKVSDDLAYLRSSIAAAQAAQQVKKPTGPS